MVPNPDKIMDRRKDAYFLNEKLLVFAYGTERWVYNNFYE